MAIQGDTKEIQDVCSQISTNRSQWGGPNTSKMEEDKEGYESPEETQKEGKEQLSPQPFLDFDID